MGHRGMKSVVIPLVCNGGVGEIAHPLEPQKTKKSAFVRGRLEVKVAK